MSLTRKKLKAFGLTEEQIESIIEDHAETVKALQDGMEKYKAEAQRLHDIQKEPEEMKDDGYKAKYEKEHSDFEAYKNEQAAKEMQTAKERAFREIIGAAGISDKRANAVLRVSDLNDLELDENGAVKNGDILIQKLKEEFSDFVVVTTERGADVMTPPDYDNGRDLGRLSMADYIAERKRTRKG